LRKETSSRRELTGPIPPPADEAVQTGTAHRTRSTRDKASQALDQVRKFIPPQFQHEICPEPDKEIVRQRIKNEKNNEKLKQPAGKKKKNWQPPIPTESELVMESF
jgi:hypothetical protein